MIYYNLDIATSKGFHQIQFSLMVLDNMFLYKIVKMNRKPYGGSLTLEFDVDWVTAPPTQEVETELNNRLQELQNLVETWSDRTCEISGRPGQTFVSIDDINISRILDPNVAKALNFVDESYHYEKQ